MLTSLCTKCILYHAVGKEQKELPQTETLLRESMLDTIELLDRRKVGITSVMSNDNNYKVFKPCQFVRLLLVRVKRDNYHIW